MSRNELREVGVRLLEEARALRAAFPDPAALRAVAISPLPAAAMGGDWPAAPFLAALRYVWDEMHIVRDGRAATLDVLDDEMAIAMQLIDRV